MTSALEQAKEGLSALVSGKRDGLIEGVDKKLEKVFKPFFRDMLAEQKASNKSNNKALADAVSNIKIEVPQVINVPEVKIPDINIDIPEVKIPPINVPTPEVTVFAPDVIVPKADAPIVNIPDRMDVGLKDFSREMPMPVLQVDSKGKPVSQVVSSTGGRGPQTLPVEHADEHLPFRTESVITRAGTSFDLDQARKHIDEQRAFFFFGFNEVLASSTWEDVHPAGGDINWLESAVTVEVSSASASDTAAGVGTQSVEIHGLSDVGADQDEVIVMNGTSTTESSLTYTRVNKMHNEVVGTYGGSHAGNISVFSRGGATEGVLLSRMTGREGEQDASVQYGSGEAGNGYWTVPLGKVLYITRLDVIPNTKANQTVDVVLYEREGILDTTTPYDPRRIIWSAIEITEPIEKEFKSHIKIKGLTDLFFRAQASGAGSKVFVSLDFYVLEADEDGA